MNFLATRTACNAKAEISEKFSALVYQTAPGTDAVGQPFHLRQGFHGQVFFGLWKIT